MSNAKSKQAKPKTGLARCMELAADRKGLVFLAAVLSSLAAIRPFWYFWLPKTITAKPILPHIKSRTRPGFGLRSICGNFR